MSVARNLVGAQTILALLRGDISQEDALTALNQPPRQKCRVGAHGVCLTHGQLIHECKKEARDDHR